MLYFNDFENKSPSELLNFDTWVINQCKSQRAHREKLLEINIPWVIRIERPEQMLVELLRLVVREELRVHV